MGGRGTYATGNNAAYRYKTVDKIEDVKVLTGKDGLHDLPMESHSSKMYIKLNHDGTFNMLRVYGGDHLVKLEIAYHVDSTLSKTGEKVLHYHTYEYGSQFKDGMHREDGIRLHKGDQFVQEFGKYLKGVKL